MSVQPEFDSQSDADDAYAAYVGAGDSSGSDDGGNSDPGDGEWSDPQAEGKLGQWTLQSQSHTTDDRKRWFVTRSTSSAFEAITSSGTAKDVSNAQSMAEIPHFETRQAAVDAYNRWAEANGGETVNTPPDSKWGEWQTIRQIDPWWLWVQERKDGSKARFQLNSMRGGQAVYLNDAGEVTDAPYLFESVEAVQSALDKYFQRVADGEVPEGQQPNGDAPSKETVTKATSETYRESHTQTQTKTSETLAGKKVLLAAVGVAGLLALKRSETK